MSPDPQMPLREQIYLLCCGIQFVSLTSLLIIAYMFEPTLQNFLVALGYAVAGMFSTIIKELMK